MWEAGWKSPRWLTALGAAVVVGVLLAGAAGSAAERVEGDPQAWKEITAAWQQLQNLHGYRARQRDASGAMEMVMEFERRGQEHAVRIVTTVRQGGTEVRAETVRIGQQAWQKMAVPGAGDLCRTIDIDQVPTGPFVLEVRTEPAEDQVVHARTVGPSTGPGGVPVVVYEYRSRRASETTWEVTTLLQVERRRGLPVRMVVETQSGKFTWDFYDFNAPVQVRKPAGC